MKGSCITTTQVVLSLSVMFLSGYLLIEKVPRMCLVWTLPLRCSCTLPFQAFPMPTPATTNTDVLVSILLHCIFAHSYFAPRILNGQGPRIESCFPGFKAGSVQDGALRRGQERQQQCGGPPFPPWSENIPPDFSSSFQRPSSTEKAVCVGDSLTSDTLLQWVRTLISY